MTNDHPLPVLGLMLGDATGIGPEQCARILADNRMKDTARLLVVGDMRVLALGMRDAQVDFACRRINEPEDEAREEPAVPLLDLGNFDPASVPRGAMSPASGKASGDTLAAMVELALAGRLDGVVFAPLNKAALHAGGWRFNDEHQMFAHLTRHAGHFGEMNVLDNLWTSRATSHVSLRTALDQLTPARIDAALTLADATMRAAGFAAPRIAVAALNPHGGEGGLFGRDEIDIIAPAVAAAAKRGIACKGPYPADTVFLKAFAGEFDGVLSMYHDQGQIAMKIMGFERGVTLHGGLLVPVATSASGSAFDIAGRNVARIDGLQAAFDLCVRMASAAG